jgi:hypothetical protein
MQKRTIFLLFTFALLAFGCSERASMPLAPAGEETIGIEADVQAQAWGLVQQAEWSVETSKSDMDQLGLKGSPQRPAPPLNFKRTVIADDVVHYSAIVRTGPGVYDKIGIHRVVREDHPCHPIRTQKAFFMLHGDLKRFETMFIPGLFSSHLPDDFGIAVFLARNDVDVWGIDQAWNFVPREATDFSFFADWGIQKEVDHLEVALGIARVARVITGNGLDKMLLLGYSSGSATGYALLNQESQWPAGRRQVKGFVSADMGVKSDDPDWLTSWAGWLEYYQGLYDAGQYQDPIYIFADVAMLARTDPGGDSPYIPGLTNWQCALFYGGGQIFGNVASHYHAPVLEDGLPVDFQFITIDQWLDFITATGAYEPILFERDYSVMLAGLPSPYNDHLGDITIPVFDIGGAGGIAPYTAATRSYLGSNDITYLYVTVGAPDPTLDYGHIDIFTASNAPQLVWQPVLQWIEDHSGSGGVQFAGQSSKE